LGKTGNLGTSQKGKFPPGRIGWPSKCVFFHKKKKRWGGKERKPENREKRGARVRCRKRGKVKKKTPTTLGEKKKVGDPSGEVRKKPWGGRGKADGGFHGGLGGQNRGVK